MPDRVLPTWRLMRGEVILGTLRALGPDMPWFECEFEAEPEFEQLRPLYVRELELLEASEDRWDEFLAALAEIDALGLVLQPVGLGQMIADFMLHVEGNHARLRYE